MQTVFNALRQKNSSLVRSLVKFDKMNLDYNYPKVVGGRRALHKAVDDEEEEEVTEEVLFEAIQQKNPSRVREIVKLNQIFLDYGDPDRENRTALHLAASLGSLEIVKILVEEGRISMGFRNKFGEYPRHVAARNGHYDIFRYLVKFSQNRKFLLRAVRHKNVSLVQNLIKSDKSLVVFRYNGNCELGGTILHVAACVGSLEIVKILVEEGGANFREGNEIDELPKQLAAQFGHVDIVHYLTQAGCTCDVDFYMEQAEQDKQANDKLVKSSHLSVRLNR